MWNSPEFRSSQLDCHATSGVKNMFLMEMDRGGDKEATLLEYMPEGLEHMAIYLVRIPCRGIFGLKKMFKGSIRN